MITNRRKIRRGIEEGVLGHFTKSAAFLAEIDNDTNTTALGAPNAFFDREGKIRLARTNI